MLLPFCFFPASLSLDKDLGAWHNKCQRSQIQVNEKVTSENSEEVAADGTAPSSHSPAARMTDPLPLPNYTVQIPSIPAITVLTDKTARTLIESVPLNFLPSPHIPFKYQ
jgi:hypothetical protein